MTNKNKTLKTDWTQGQKTFQKKPFLALRTLCPFLFMGVK